MAIVRKSNKIKMNVYYTKELKKTKISNITRTIYNFKLYGNDGRKYYVIRFNGNEMMSMLLEAYIGKHGMEKGGERFEEFLELLREIQKKGQNPFWLFTAKYTPKEKNKTI